MCNSVITRYLNPRKSRSVNICLSVFDHIQVHQFCVVICCLFVSFFSSHYSSSGQLFCIHIRSFCLIISNLLQFLVCSFSFIRLFIIQLLSVIFCSDTGYVFQLFLDPKTTSIQQDNKLQTTRLCHLLSQYRKREPVTVIDISGIYLQLGTWVRRGQDRQANLLVQLHTGF